MNTIQSACIIKNLCRTKGNSISSMLLELNIRKSLIYDMEKRNCIPASDVLEKIADYLDCSVDYLLGRTDNPEINKSKAIPIDINKDMNSSILNENIDEIIIE